MKTARTIVLLVLWQCMLCAESFLLPRMTSTCQSLFLVEDVREGDLLGVDEDCDIAKDSDVIHKSLLARQDSLRMGIGKRYICRTQLGFLNVHKEPADPFETANIVNTLTDGQIVTSTGPARGSWIRHDAGGWSISVYEGFQWLTPIDE